MEAPRISSELPDKQNGDYFDKSTFSLDAGNLKNQKLQLILPCILVIFSKALRRESGLARVFNSSLHLFKTS
jgi:hypothetical protein